MLLLAGKQRPLLFAAMCALFGALTGLPRPSLAQSSPPVIDQSIVATFIAGRIELTGANLGSGATSREIRTVRDGALTANASGTATEGGMTGDGATGEDRGTALAPADGDGETTTITSSDPRIDAWTDDAVSFRIATAAGATEIKSGTLTVIVDGRASNPVRLQVYGYSTADVPDTGQVDRPLALALSPEAGRVWVNSEFHTDFTEVDPTVPPAARKIPIDQAPGGVFSYISNDVPWPGVGSPVSSAGEDIEVDANGDVWLTQGGGAGNCAPLADPCDPGDAPNASRIVRFRPGDDKPLACYTIPGNSPEVWGIAIDTIRNRVWYSASGLSPGANAIGSFRYDDAALNADCLLPRGQYGVECATPFNSGCHTRFPLPHPASAPVHIAVEPGTGNIWFTEYWGGRIGRMTPDGVLTHELPMPPPAHNLCVCPFGPWEIAFDDDGGLWVSEYWNATLAYIDTDQLDNPAVDCRTLDGGGANPCVTRYEVLPQAEGYHIHSIAAGTDGKIWFAASPIRPGASKLGFISTRDGNEVVLLPDIGGARSIAGMRQDRDASRGEPLWFAAYDEGPVWRLELNSDGDDVPAGADNCPAAYNPAQPDNDGDGLGDICDEDDDGDTLPDWFERENFCLDALSADDPAADHDNPPDLVSTRAEMQAGTKPCDPDTDGDGFNDYPSSQHTGPANTNPLIDNCILERNRDQRNSDGNFIDVTPPRPEGRDDRTAARSDARGDACDDDDDNDGQLDILEIYGLVCDAATGRTSPILADSDGDRVLDGAECNLGSDPTDGAARPAWVVAPDADADGVPNPYDPNDGDADSDDDGITDRIEFRGYNTDLGNANTDGDVCSDRREIAAVDMYTVVNAASLALVGQALGRPGVHANMDIDKNGSINASDLGLVAAAWGYCR